MIPVSYDLFINKNKYSNPINGLLIGSSIYAIGMIGNYYVHKQLSKMRKDNMKLNNGNKKYFIPYGNIFNYTWTPHYMFELFTWIGMSITSKSLLYYITVILSTSYLFGRAYSTKLWYQNMFDNCPKRAAIIPFVY